MKTPINNIFIKKETLMWILMFLMCCGVRLYWAGMKGPLYGDELLSVCIAYDQPGWGDLVFPTHQVFTGEELRQAYYMDDKGGIEGYLADMHTLYTDNHDASHASLYYMVLRSAFCLMQGPSMQTLIGIGVGINLLFFVITFWCVAWIMKRFYPDQNCKNALFTGLIMMVPGAVSCTLLVREYAMAMAAFTLWGAWCVACFDRLKAGVTLNKLFIIKGALAGCLLLSTGYFNGIFWCLTGLVLIIYSCRKKRIELLSTYFLLLCATLLLCWAIYPGFFNFFTDVRTQEVAQKVEGEDFINNLTEATVHGVYIMLFRVLTPMGAIALAAWCFFKLKKGQFKTCVQDIPHPMLLLSTLAWFVIVMLLANWKATRYVLPCTPLLLCFMWHPLRVLSLQTERWGLPAFALTLCVFSFHNRFMEYLWNTFPSNMMPSADQTILLYGPNKYENNTLSLLIPHIADTQKLVIIEQVNEMHTFTPAHQDTLYVYGAINMPALTRQKSLVSQVRINDWMSKYSYVREK